MNDAVVSFQVDDINLKQIRSEGIGWNDVSDEIESFANSVANRLDAISRKPKEVCVEFGLSVGIEGGLVVVSGDAKANVKVMIKW